jgi:uncharacterized protein with HEPN domain
VRNNLERLQDILEAIFQIEKYTFQGQENFEHDNLIQIWVLHHLLIIGEAANKISDTLKSEYPDVAWRGTIDVRNLIIHEYFRVDLDIIWRIVKHDLPPLKQQIEQILQQLHY